MLIPDSVVELLIEKPAAGGRMIARHEGQVVLVSAAIPGERVQALVERVSQGVGYARTVDLVESSPDRRRGSRDWACGGNVYAHVAYPRQLVIKGQVIADALARIGKIRLEAPIPVTGSPEDGYRMRARFHVRGRMLGFFREGTHQLCDPAGTGQLLPDTNDLVRELAERVRGGSLQGVTEVELAENIPASERALHFELDRPVTPIGLADVAKLPTLVGVSASFGAAGGRRTVTAGGTPCVLDRLVLQVGQAGLKACSTAETAVGEVAAATRQRPEATAGEAAVGKTAVQTAVGQGFSPAQVREVELQLQHHAEAFFQGNRYLLAPLASRVVSLVPEGPVVDLYAGVGLFAASLAAAGWTSIAAVEGDRAAAADLRANASPFGPELTPIESAVEHYLTGHPVGQGTTIVIDPPRTGMSKEASAAVAAQAASRLIYVSCDVATFARDARRLVDAGYRLAHLEGFDLFPNTAHVETIGVYERE
jgi:tRNA/tmRNA/rRNA uracil-C5-methylase (TrmA/RlmC/RlmD family)